MNKWEQSKVCVRETEGIGGAISAEVSIIGAVLLWSIATDTEEFFICSHGEQHTHTYTPNSVIQRLSFSKSLLNLLHSALILICPKHYFLLSYNFCSTCNSLRSFCLHIFCISLCYYMSVEGKHCSEGIHTFVSVRVYVKGWIEGTIFYHPNLSGADPLVLKKYPHPSTFKILKKKSHVHKSII